MDFDQRVGKNKVGRVEMRILHIVPGLDDPTCGIAVAAKLIAAEQSKLKHEVEVVETSDFVQSNILAFKHYSEIWVHSMWLPRTMLACWKVLRAKENVKVGFDGPRLVRMTHANLDPVRLGYHGWKKRLVSPMEKWLFRRTDRVVVTCEAEKVWCRKWGVKGEIEVVDLKRYFDLSRVGREGRVGGGNESLHVLYIGRPHPLKGVKFLERAVEELNRSFEHSNIRTFDLHCVSNHFGEELERDWEWCDVLCLPTLSENFGLVVAEALERGKRVITTDGAPAWGEGEMFECSECSNVRMGYGGRLVYLKGFRDGTDDERVRLLKEALEKV